MKLKLWGSECLECGNATHATQRCDTCGRTSRTVPLYMLDAKPGSVREPDEELSIHRAADNVT